MTDKKEMHRQFAVQTFNGVWDLLGKQERTKMKRLK